MEKIKLRHAGLLVAVIVLLNGIALIYGDQIGSRLIPYYSFVFSKMTEHYQLQNMRLEKESGETVFKVHVITKGRLSIERNVPLDVELSSSTLVAHSLQMIIVFFSVLFVWPVKTFYQRPLLLVFSLPFLAVILAIDVPLVLLGSLEDLVLYYYHFALLENSPVVLWMSIMNSGGRLALALFVPLALIGVFQIINKRKQQVSKVFV